MTSSIKLGRVEIHFLVLFLFLFSLLFDFAYYLSAVYAFVLVHELSHAAAALLLHVKPEKLEILPFGAVVHISGAYVKKTSHEVIIASAGPFCSAVLAFFFHKAGWDSFFVTANAALAAVNIIPALPLDGGRILRAAMTEKWGYVKAFNFTLRLTKICAAIMTIAGAAALFYTSFNFSLLLISAFLIVNTLSERRAFRHIIMDEIIKSKKKLESGYALRGDIIAISADEPACKALKLLGYNKYYFINIVDSDMNIIGTVTETRLIEQLARTGIRTKAAKMVDLDNNE